MKAMDSENITLVDVCLCTIDLSVNGEGGNAKDLVPRPLLVGMLRTTTTPP